MRESEEQWEEGSSATSAGWEDRRMRELFGEEACGGVFEVGEGRLDGLIEFYYCKGAHLRRHPQNPQKLSVGPYSAPHCVQKRGRDSKMGGPAPCFFLRLQSFSIV